MYQLILFRRWLRSVSRSLAGNGAIRLCSFPVTVALILLHGTIKAQVTGTYQPAYWADPGSTSTFLRRDTGSSCRYMPGTVDPYSGQHVEDFSLYSLSGRGGLKLGLVLHYQGSVKDVATSQNCDKQVSPFGLGFDLRTSAGVQYVQVEHNNTAYISDDKYWMVIDGAPIEMKPIPTEPNHYVLGDGRPWHIVRLTSFDSIDELDVTIGFNVTTEDGTIYQLGDLDSSPINWNATQYIARFGRIVRPGFVREDSVDAYPHQWYLKRIHDVQDLNAIVFKYARDSFLVGYPSQEGRPGLWGTRATYLKEIATSDGQKIVLTYVNREDVQGDRFSATYDGGVLVRTGLYDFYQEKRIDKVELRSRNDELISQIQFQMSCLSFNFGQQHLNEFKKLLLESYQFVSPDGLMSLPPCRFEYYDDSLSVAVGSIRRVIYPSSSIKEINYRPIEQEDTNFTRLDTSIDIGQFLRGQFLVATASEDLMLWSSFIDNLTGPLQGCFWDSYWHPMPEITAEDRYDRLPRPWNDGWFVNVRKSGSAVSIIVRRWMGGYWDEQSFPQECSYFMWEIYPDHDGFLAHMSGGSDYYDYYHWDGQNWLKQRILDRHDGEEEHAVKVQDGVIAISFGVGSNSSRVFLAKFNSELSTVDTLRTPAFSGAIRDSAVAIGPDVVAFLTQNRAYVYRYNDLNQQWQNVLALPEAPECYTATYGIASFPFGVSWTCLPDGATQTHMITARFTDQSGLFDMDDRVDTQVGTSFLAATNHSLFYGHGWHEWLYDHWGSPHELGYGSDRSVGIFPGAIRFSAYANGSFSTVARQFSGMGRWSTAGVFSDTLGSSCDGVYVIDQNKGGGSGRYLSRGIHSTVDSNHYICSVQILGNVAMPCMVLRPS